MKFARIQNGKVFETINFPPDGKFHPSLTWVEVPDEVEQHWTKEPDGTFKAPEQTVEVESEQLLPTPPTTLVLSVVKFKMCFTSAERLAIYELKDFGDKVITDWLAILDDPRSKSVDLSLGGVQDAVNYLIGKIPGFDNARAEEVLSGHLI